MTTSTSSASNASPCSNCAARLNSCEQRLSVLENSLAEVLNSLSSALNSSREHGILLRNAVNSFAEFRGLHRAESDRRKKEDDARDQIYSQILHYVSSQSEAERRKQQ